MNQIDKYYQIINLSQNLMNTLIDLHFKTYIPYIKVTECLSFCTEGSS